VSEPVKQSGRRASASAGRASGPLRLLVRLTQPLVWRIATAYGIRVDRHCYAYGEHALTLEDPPEVTLRTVPRSVYFNTRSGRILVGANTVFGEDVRVLTGKHANLREARLQGVPLHHVPEGGRDIVIGRNCYIGTAAIIIGPVTIGDHAVIGAGAVVTHDVEPATFVAGVPARLVARLGAQ
jgi:acetyltransferase-like isoleucine patch superfamily enzyme